MALSNSLSPDYDKQKAKVLKRLLQYKDCGCKHEPKMFGFLTRFTTKWLLCLAWFPRFANNFYSPVTQDFSEPENQTEVVSVNLFTIITCTWDFQVLLPYTHSILFSYSLCR